MQERQSCMSCTGSGEMPTDSGMIDCPDCGGAGRLPPRSVLVDWRSRDIERVVNIGRTIDATDTLWLIAELRKARSALTQILALAHDIQDAGSIAQRIRFAANDALGLYETRPADTGSAESE